MHPRAPGNRNTKRSKIELMIMNSPKHTPSLRLAVLSTLAAFSFPFAQPSVWAADHGDSPVASNHQQCDIADVYAFMSPEAGQGDNVILIATIRGFIVPGENSNFGIFDPLVRYRFHLETTDDAKADKTIDVTFSPRVGAPQGGNAPAILEVPQNQTATLKFTGFKDGNKKLKPITGALTTSAT